MSAQITRGPLTRRRLSLSADFMRQQRVRAAARRVVLAQQKIDRLRHQVSPTAEREELVALRAFFAEAGPLFARANDGENE